MVVLDLVHLFTFILGQHKGNFLFHDGDGVITIQYQWMYIMQSFQSSYEKLFDIVIVS